MSDRHDACAPTFLLLYAKRTLVFRKRTAGSEMISIYGDYFIIITSLKTYLKLIEIDSWGKVLFSCYESIKLFFALYWVLFTCNQVFGAYDLAHSHCIY